FSRDWSSDVCSSDLEDGPVRRPLQDRREAVDGERAPGGERLPRRSGLEPHAYAGGTWYRGTPSSKEQTMRAGWRFWRYKIHWQILLAIALGVGAGAALQLLDARPQLDFRIDEVGRVEKIGTDARRAGIQVGDR